MAKENPAIERKRLAEENKFKWVKYNKRWFTPVEWYSHCRAEGTKSLPGEFHDIDDILGQARNLILKKTKEKQDVSALLTRYFEFEKRVRNYAEEQGKLKALANKY